MEIRRAARVRRCQAVGSEEFVPMLLAAPPTPPTPAEPDEKHGAALSPEQRRAWLREFGVE